MIKENSVIQKRITKTQYQNITNNKPHLPWLFEFFIAQRNDDEYFIIIKIKRIFFPIAFIVELIAQFFYCLWNEGLKNITFLTSRTIEMSYLTFESLEYNKAIRYWNM